MIDDHSRVAYVEARDDETAQTAVEVLANAVAWFADRGITVQRVLSDNGSAYRSHLWAQTCTELGISPKRTIAENQEAATRPRPASKDSKDSKRWSSCGLANAGLGRDTMSHGRVTHEGAWLRCDDLTQLDRLNETRNLREERPSCDSVGAAQVSQ